jgi:hypothetical protein
MNRYNAIYIQMKQFSFATIYWGCFGNNMNIFVIAYLLFQWKWICAEFFSSPFWVEVDLCRVFFISFLSGSGSVQSFFYLLFQWKWICAEFFLSPFWVEVDLCRVFFISFLSGSGSVQVSSFAYICVAILEIQLSRARTWIYNVICCDIFVFNDLRWEVVICFVDISRIIEASLFKLSWPLHILVILLRPFGSFVPKDVTLI